MKKPHRITAAAPIDPLSFWTDAATVVMLRCLRIASGGSAGAHEAQLMVSEKISALAHVHFNLLTGAYGISPHSMIDGVAQHYARGVQANRQRLSAPSTFGKKQAR